MMQFTSYNVMRIHHTGMLSLRTVQIQCISSRMSFREKLMDKMYSTTFVYVSKGGFLHCAVL